MVKRKVVRKKKVARLSEAETEERRLEGALPEKSVREEENRQLFWFFVVVGVVFVLVFATYFGVEGARAFEYGGVDWRVEEYAEPTGTIYHGRFPALSNPNVTYNLYLRGDPRENAVATEGVFDSFKNGGVVSMTPEVDACRGELARVMLDLGTYMKQGIGVGVLRIGSTDKFVALETDRRYARCNTVSDRTIVIIDIGKSMVVQDDNNPYCYTIYANDCNDVSSVEKFMLKSIVDFGKEQ